MTLDSDTCATSAFKNTFEIQWGFSWVILKKVDTTYQKVGWSNFSKIMENLNLLNFTCDCIGKRNMSPNLDQVNFSRQFATQCEIYTPIFNQLGKIALHLQKLHKPNGDSPLIKSAKKKCANLSPKQHKIQLPLLFSSSPPQLRFAFNHLKFLMHLQGSKPNFQS